MVWALKIKKPSHCISATNGAAAMIPCHVGSVVTWGGQWKDGSTSLEGSTSSLGIWGAGVKPHFLGRFVSSAVTQFPHLSRGSL